MTGPSTRAFVRIALVLVLAIVVILGTSDPAAAHGASGATEMVTTNYRYRIDSFAPEVAGVEMTFVAATGQLQLTNTSDAEVVVQGYSGEPYLRIGPDGISTNALSPATYLNADGSGAGNATDSANPAAEPRWQHISEETTVRWHDHRAHWMAGTPAAVANDPGSVHELTIWAIPIEVDGQVVVANGATAWVPPPSTGLWWFTTALVAIAATVALATRWWRGCTAAFAGLVAIASLTAMIGMWTASPTVWATKAFAIAIPVVALGCIGIGVALLRSRPWDGIILVAMGAGVLVLLQGLALIDHFGASSLPTSLPTDLDRAAVAVIIGGGVGLALGPLLHWLRSRAVQTSTVSAAS